MPRTFGPPHKRNLIKKLRLTTPKSPVRTPTTVVRRGSKPKGAALPPIRDLSETKTKSSM